MKKTNKKKTQFFKYELDIQWSEEDQCYIVIVPELPGCTTHGETPAEAVGMAQEAIELHIESLTARGLEVPVPISEEELSGEFLVRTGDPTLHRKLKMAAKAKKKALNTFVVETLREAVGIY
jgi:predicted RNase H-like HicB family nuclease